MKNLFYAVHATVTNTKKIPTFLLIDFYCSNPVIWFLLKPKYAKTVEHGRGVKSKGLKLPAKQVKNARSFYCVRITLSCLMSLI